MGSKINHSWFLPSRVAVCGETDVFTASYKVRVSVTKCHGEGKILTIEVGNGKGTG